MAITALSAVVLSATGMGLEESVGSAISCMSNTGLAFDRHGMSDGYANIPVFSKWYMSFLMLTGRLEIFTVLSLFMPGFWQK